MGGENAALALVLAGCSGDLPHETMRACYERTDYFKAQRRQWIPKIVRGEQSALFKFGGIPDDTAAHTTMLPQAEWQS